MDGFCDNSEKGDHQGDLPCTLVGVYYINKLCGDIFISGTIYNISKKNILPPLLEERFY